MAHDTIRGTERASLWSSDDSDADDNDEGEILDENGIHLNQIRERNEWKYLKQLLTMEYVIENYKEVLIIYQYLFSLPSTQVKCERDFSYLSSFKTAIRSSIEDKMLECRFLINFSKDLIPLSDHSKIIDIIAKSSQKLRTKLLT